MCIIEDRNYPYKFEQLKKGSTLKNVNNWGKKVFLEMSTNENSKYSKKFSQLRSETTLRNINNWWKSYT